MDDKTFDDPKIAQEWMETVEGEGARIRETDIYPRIRSWINRVSPLEILEIGSGQGACSDKVELRGRKFTGLEPSPFLVDRANGLYLGENRRFVVGNVYSMPFLDGTFDAAFSVAVWHLLSDLKTAARELCRVLKPSGHFLIITANPGAYVAWTNRYTSTQMDGFRFKGKVEVDGQRISDDVLYLHALDDILNSLRSVDLRVHETETFRNLKASTEKQYISIRGQRIG